MTKKKSLKNSNKHSSRNKNVQLVLLSLLIIIIVGVFLFSNKNSPTKTTQMTPTPTKALQAPESWPSFSSDTFGFTHQYPNDWLNDNFCYQCDPQPVIENAHERYFHPHNSNYPEGITYSVSDKRYSANVKTLVELVETWNFTNKTSEEIEVDGYPGVKISGILEGSPTTVVIFENKNYIIQMRNNGNYQAILEQMLASFKLKE